MLCYSFYRHVWVYVNMETRSMRFRAYTLHNKWQMKWAWTTNFMPLQPSNVCVCVCARNVTVAILWRFCIDGTTWALREHYVVRVRINRKILNFFSHSSSYIDLTIMRAIVIIHQLLCVINIECGRKTTKDLIKNIISALSNEYKQNL